MLILILNKLGLAWQEFKAYRLIQFHAHISNQTQFGSTRVTIDHKIADINSKPNSNQVIITPIENATVSKISPHIMASSPIVFILPSKPVDTSTIENYLINSAHKSSIYFTNSIRIPDNYSFLRSSKLQTNSIKQNTILYNIIGTINLSGKTNQNVILITASYDTFSAAPSLEVGASNGISISSFLELIHVISNYTLPKNYGLIFAMTSGRFCGMEGLQHFLDTNTIKVKFAVAIESISGPILRGHLNRKPPNGSQKVFNQLLFNLKATLNQVEIPLEIKHSEALFSQTVFSIYDIPSVAISGGPLYSSLTDTYLNISRSDGFTWAFSEALMRTIYDLPPLYEVVDRKGINTSLLARSIGNTPRLAPFIDNELPRAIGEWIGAFADSMVIDKWESRNCYAPYSSTECFLSFYNPVPRDEQVLFIFISIFYALCVYLVMAGIRSIQSLFRILYSCISRCFCFLILKNQ